jgi:hypothetical protein
MPPACLLCGLALTLALAAPAVAEAGTSARLFASFSPNRLGARTTLQFGFSFSVPPGGVPPPLTQVELRYPRNLGIELSGLGLATCTARILTASGPRGCPTNSVMGYGVVLTGIVLGTTVITESAPITILRAPYSANDNLALLFYAEGTRPVTTDIVFSGLLVPAPVPFGGQVDIGVPLVPTLPGAPYISVIRLHATIGPRGVTYYERVANETLAYRPQGILMPHRCPRGGFQFSVEFSFSDQSHTRARTAARCPHRITGGTRRR